MKNNVIKILFCIFIIALFLRLLAVFSQKEIDKLPRSDASEYDEMAVNLTLGNGLSLFRYGIIVPVAYRTPAYPMFLTGIYSIFGHDYTAANIILLILLSTRLAAIITFGEPMYRYPYEPYLIIFSALTLGKMFSFKFFI